MSPDKTELLNLLDETMALLALPENDFSASIWPDARAARAEIQGYRDRWLAGREIDLFQLRLLFAPHGPLQEVSLRSGWGDVFFDLAYRLEAALSN